MTSTHAACELLAPAGDWDALRAAAANGADAVYFGLANFNARHRAANFSLEELPQVVEYLHRRNVRGYVTVNTLIFSDELVEAAECIAAIARAGADAVIVQDMGLVRLIRAVAPQLPVHASTQMTLTEPRGMEFVRQLGVDRAIAAREASIGDLKKVMAANSLPVEVFVHGALCVAYSGQCLTSEALGGRSANRGQCAQACRLPYDLVVDGETRDLGDVAYLLSPQDLAAHDMVDDLVAAGICSLKIEGRLKSAHYVAATTQTYRAALDAALAGRRFTASEQQQLDLSQSFSRGFAPGFLQGINHQRLVQGRFPKARGVRLGMVVQTTSHGVIVEFAEGVRPELVKPGDGIVFDEGRPDQDEQGGRVYAVREAGHAQRRELVFGEGAVNLAVLTTDAIVWRTDDPQMRRRMEQTFNREKVAHREAIDFALGGRVGGELTLEASDAGGRKCAAIWSGPLALAAKHPVTEAGVREQLDRLGDTPYRLGAVRLDVVEPVMVPKSVLNDLRRRVVDELLVAKLGEHGEREVRIEALNELRASAAEARSEEAKHGVSSPSLHVLVRTDEQLSAVLAWRPEGDLLRPASVYCDFEDVRRYRDAVARCREAAMPVGLATLRIIKPDEEGLLRQIAKCDPDAVLVRNLAGMTFFCEHAPHLPRIGDFSLNVTNELTADLLRREGLVRLTPGYDLSWDQYAAMLKRIDPRLFETVIHQHMPMFHMEHCVFCHTLSTGTDATNCGRPCDRHRVRLRDRTGAEFPLLADTGCRNTVFNSVPQSAAEYLPRMMQLGLRHFRVELLLETEAEVAAMLDRYARVLTGVDDGPRAWRGLQVLSQLGVTRGTLRD